MSSLGGSQDDSFDLHNSPLRKQFCHKTNRKSNYSYQSTAIPSQLKLFSTCFGLLTDEIYSFELGQDHWQNGGRQSELPIMLSLIFTIFAKFNAFCRCLRTSLMMASARMAHLSDFLHISSFSSRERTADVSLLTTQWGKEWVVVESDGKCLSWNVSKALYSKPKGDVRPPRQR